MVLPCAAAVLVTVSAGLPSPKQLMKGHVDQPRHVAATPAEVSKLELPPGFQIAVLARDLGNPRMLLQASNHFLYVTVPDKGELLAIQLTGGRASKPHVVLAGHPRLHGIAEKDGVLYLASEREVLSAPLLKDGKLGPAKKIADLPEGGNHPYRTVGIGPDGLLYVSVGSTCNDCREKAPEHATLLRMNLDGSGRSIFARGLRNTIGFGWHPHTHAMWGFDQGIDWLGDDEPMEELNLLQQGKDYGWPDAYDARKVNPSSDGTNAEKQQHAASSEPPVLGYQAHSSPIWMLFYDGTMFPPEYRGDAFIAFHGSWNRKPPTGHKVVRVRFQDGKPVGFEDFLTGFLEDDHTFGRPAGLAALDDGSLVVGDDTNGVLYRVTYTGRK